MAKAAAFEDAGDPRREVAERSRRPLVVAAAIALLGFVVLAPLLIGIGLLITSSSFSDSIMSWDGSVSRWFEAHRAAPLNTWTDIGSIMAGTGTILAVAGLSLAIMVLRRLWYDVTFLAVALFVEFAVFLTTTAIVDRPRPTIQALDPLPVTSSFPSGHTAASIATYAGLAFLVALHNRDTLVRIVAWTLGVLIPLWVGLSRIYRGLHHPTDVAASVVLGIGALLIAALAARAATAAAERRRAAEGQPPPARTERAEVPA
jgi:undecaprenyl-diphosphatase